MRVVVLTVLRANLASLCLPRLCQSSHVKLTRVILARGGSPNRKRILGRKLRKVWRIGLLGALNGIRMRAWYRVEAPDIEQVCEQCGVEFAVVESLNSPRTAELMRGADIGLSLGNGYISERVFSTPRLGMLNVHTEILPQFKGAQGIIWPLWEGRSETGYTVHEINREIDAGRILYQQRMPIRFGKTLRETVINTHKCVFNAVPDGLVHVLEDYASLVTNAQPNVGGRHYTTPSACQFARMLWNHQRLARAAMEHPAAT